MNNTDGRKQVPDKTYEYILAMWFVFIFFVCFPAGMYFAETGNVLLAVFFVLIGFISKPSIWLRF